MSITLLSPGDFVDLWFEVRRRGWMRLLKHLHPKAEARVTTTFDCIDPGAVDWWTIPAVRARWNQMITGDPKLEYQPYVCGKYLAGRRGLQMISVGCGGGTAEIRFAQQEHFERVLGMDLSERIVRHATGKAERKQLHHLHFFRADAETYDYGEAQFDLVLFHSSLHHLYEPEKMMLKIRRALRPGGLLVVHEYTGPNRNQWSDAQLDAINRLLKNMPEKYRVRVNEKKIKRQVYRPGLLRMWLNDPSEAVHSEILPDMLRKHFHPLEEKTFGGNLLHLLLKDIGHHFRIEEPETMEILQQLFKAEDEFLSAGHRGDFSFGVYQKESA